MIEKLMVGGVCGRERPDFVFECAGYYCILEVDEFQHSHYTQECEYARMINISQSLGMPTIFIRYNPDRYSVNEKITDTSQHDRLEKLKSVLDIFLHLDIQNITKYGYCSSLYLFYNGYRNDDINPTPLLMFEI